MIKRRPDTKPKVVVYAVTVLFLALAVQAINTVLKGLQLVMSATILGLIMIGLLALLVAKVSQGRNWARITYLLYFFWSFSFVDWRLLLDIHNRYSELSTIEAIGLTLFALQFWALYALFTFPGSDWFLKPGKPSPEAG
jgi:hypothetical protein